MNEIDSIVNLPFSFINFRDIFFDSLREHYEEFDDWYQRKSIAGERAYVSYENGHVIAFLYLKYEAGIDITTQPQLSKARIKIGTFKVDFTHHSSIGKRLLAIALRTFADSQCPYIYVTTHDADHTKGLRTLLQQYGFIKEGNKGKEELWIKQRPQESAVIKDDPYLDYPFISLNKGYRNYYLPIAPEYHALMFSTRLSTEKDVPIEDVARVNSIEKVYLANMSFINQLKRGDHLIIYRSAPKDTNSAAHYTSVVSAVCTAIETKNIHDFSSYNDFSAYIKGRSVFTDEELQQFWDSKEYKYIALFVENFAFKIPYPNRKKLLDNQLINRGYVGGQKISDQQLDELIQLGGHGESFVIH
ncbi:hypothetical protein [Alloscardovia criceti]|uniref:hypothetical protein n=1 Tax=Alloscardovia criceti TaxID=356828 RepID=UPI000366E476|nr:hypothetical protein [Alloscardovia criceti]